MEVGQNDSTGTHEASSGCGVSEITIGPKICMICKNLGSALTRSGKDARIRCTGSTVCNGYGNTYDQLGMYHCRGRKVPQNGASITANPERSLEA